jgi:hypothetical protein
MASTFSGSGGRNTALWTEQMARQQRGELEDIYSQGLHQQQRFLGPSNQRGSQYMQRGYGTAMGQINQGYGQGIDTMRQAQGQQVGAIQGGYADAANQLRAGYGEAAGQWQPFYDQSMAGYGMYQNALGLGGAGGTQAAQNAFTAGPGYQWNVDQATKGAQRAANRVGGLYSGNTNDQTTRLASNLANQEYDKWVGNLQGFQGAAQNATGALADIYRQRGVGEAALSTDQAQQLSGIYGTSGQQIANAQIGQGTAQGALSTDYFNNQAGRTIGHGQGMAGLQGQYMGNMANATNQYYQTVIPAGQQGMQAGQAAAQNRMGAIMGGLQLGSQLLGGGAGGASGGAGTGAFGSFLKGLFG